VKKGVSQDFKRTSGKPGKNPRKGGIKRGSSKGGKNAEPKNNKLKRKKKNTQPWKKT